MEKERNYLTVKEVCEYIHVSRTTVHLLRTKGILKPRKIGGRVLFIRNEIDEYINGKEA